MPDWWTDINSLQTWAQERTGYKTQKPLALLRRIVKASSNEGDMVLDPFCGCATACIAAEEQGREWIGIDISEMAADLVHLRMQDNLGLFYTGAHRTDIPQRTDLGKIPRYNAPENKQFLYGIQEGHCNGCSRHFENRNLTIDHIVSRHKGGSDHIDNLQLLCGACNSTKGTRSQEHFLAILIDRGMRKEKEHE